MKIRTDSNNHEMQMSETTIGLVGLGYVGLPAAICFAEKYQVIGYDINVNKIEALIKGKDETGEVTKEQLQESTCIFTTEAEKLRLCDFIVVAVPTPLDQENKPDLSYVKDATKLIGRNMKKGAIVIYESTVYPGATEEICLPLLEKESGLTIEKDFSIGYSPERINPGDKKNTFKTIGKVVSGDNEKTTKSIEQLYASVLEAPVYRATSIKVAEASKVVENTQRDINIAFMNELAMLFDHIGINTNDVLAASRTKWNFHPFTPGLVGGHCISIDPYYLIEKAEQMGYSPTFMKEARRINASMPQFVIDKIKQYSVKHQIELDQLSVNVLGITFKENVPDLRNSKTIEIVKGLRKLSVHVTVSDPHASEQDVMDIIGEPLVPFQSLPKADINLLAVPHHAYKDQITYAYKKLFVSDQGLMIDLKAFLSRDKFPKKMEWWTL